MSLLTTLIGKNSHNLAVIYFIFIEKRRRLNLTGFSYHIWTSVKRLGSYQLRQILMFCCKFITLIFN